MCHKLREAAKLVLADFSHCNALDLEDLQSVDARLDSHLLLDWAPSCVRKVELGDRGFELQGLLPFFRACHQLRVLEISFPEKWDCHAQADRVLATCRNLKILKCSGLVPNVLPPTLTALKVSFAPWAAAQRNRPYASGLADVLLCRLAGVSPLERLDLDLSWSPVVAAQPKLVLHRLREVRLQFIYQARSPRALDLSWLRDQPLDWLHLSIHVCAHTLDDHSTLVRQLQQLTIHHLVMEFCCESEPSAQQPWADLAIQSELEVLLCHGMTLGALSQCKDRTVGLYGYRTPDASCSILWAALTSSPGRIEVWGRSVQQIRLIGCLGSAPSLQQPWQLRVEEELPLEGLSAPCTKSRGRFLYMRNAAAEACNWPFAQYTARRGGGWH